jgi:HPt (histidine-containing phosphotransfer) domain-containing protein
MSQLIDLNFLKTFTKGDSAKMKKYITMFLDIAPTSVSDMEKHYAASSFDELKVVAHSLKPQISYMGIKHLENNIREIEMIAGSRNGVEQLEEKIAYFKIECAKACEQLNAALATL